jgi:hypothetical protein
MDEIEGVDRHTIEIIVINKFTEPEHPVCSLYKSSKTNQPSPWWTTLAHLPKDGLASAEVAALCFVVGVSVVRRQHEEVVEVSNVSAVVVEVNPVLIEPMMLVVDAPDVGEDLDGRTTTSLSEIEMPRSISSRIGRCLRRLISTDFLN